MKHVGGHGVKSTTKTPGHWIRDPCQSLKMEPGTPFKIQQWDPRNNIFLLLYLFCSREIYIYIYIYIYNMELIFHE